MSKKTTINPALYDVILSPVITEKSSAQGEFNKYTFKVAPDAAKPLIKQAVEALFSVNVTKVNVLNNEGKIKKFRGQLGQRKGHRKAVVSLKSGQVIDFASGAGR